MHLTERRDSVNCPDRQAGADEIEITNEMLEAGLSIFRSYDYRFDSDEEAVRDIYRAMEEARRVNIPVDRPSPSPL